MSSHAEVMSVLNASKEIGNVTLRLTDNKIQIDAANIAFGAGMVVTFENKDAALAVFEQVASEQRDNIIDVEGSFDPNSHRPFEHITSFVIEGNEVSIDIEDEDGISPEELEKLVAEATPIENTYKTFIDFIKPLLLYCTPMSKRQEHEALMTTAVAVGIMLDDFTCIINVEYFDNATKEGISTNIEITDAEVELLSEAFVRFFEPLCFVDEGTKQRHRIVEALQPNECLTHFVIGDKYIVANGEGGEQFAFLQNSKIALDF